MTPTELVTEGAVGAGFLSQAITFMTGLVGLRGALEAPESQSPSKYVYAVGPDGRVRKERLRAPYRP